ncbi:MAG: UTRA domain-containing protein, partial [Halanaerobium sp.]|nr:UTRA domain-containing protein [Halanaerobium sp.]
KVQDYSVTELWEITRLRLMGEKPLIFETSYIPVSLLPEVTEQELQQFSLYNLLSKNKVRVVRAKEYLEPVLPSLEVQEVLEIGPATALFQTLRYTYDAGEELVELRESLIRGDYINFSVEMTL